MQLLSHWQPVLYAPALLYDGIWVRKVRQRELE
jgi:hypothetical protein